jgi:hypothetical protein
MPLKDRDFSHATSEITNNAKNNLSGSTSKASYHMIVSADAPGIGGFLLFNPRSLFSIFYL